MENTGGNVAVVDEESTKNPLEDAAASSPPEPKLNTDVSYRVCLLKLKSKFSIEDQVFQVYEVRKHGRFFIKLLHGPREVKLKAGRRFTLKNQAFEVYNVRTRHRYYVKFLGLYE